MHNELEEINNTKNDMLKFISTHSASEILEFIKSIYVK
jgi:hypothetical protein